MKKAILSLLALPLLLACSSEENEAGGNTSRVPLQIEFDGITRSVVEGSTLPNNSAYGVFVTKSTSYLYNNVLEDGFNREVTYLDGNSKFDQLVYIPENGTCYVYAYYPYNKNLTVSALEQGFPLSLTSQTDLLFTSYYGSATESSPYAKLSMKHVFARIHVTVKKAVGNTSDYNFYGLEMNNLFKEGYYDLAGFNTNVGKDKSGSIYLKPQNNELTDNNAIEADFLILPGNQTPTLSLHGSIEKTATLPQKNYYANTQYDITLTINHLGELEASEWTIVPWDSNIQNGLDVWKDSNIN